MKRTSLLLGLAVLALVVIAPLALASAEKNPFDILSDAIAALSGRLDAFIADTAAGQAAQDATAAALQTQIDALETRIDALEAVDDGPGVGSGPDAGGGSGGVESGGDDVPPADSTDPGVPEETL